MSDRIPYVALYAHDFMADIGHLGNTELGIYWRLLLVYYRDLRPLPSDMDKLRRLAMTFSPEEQRSLESVVADFFVPTVEPDGTRVYRHKRADIEIDKARNARQTRIDGANKTNAKRWGSLSDRSAISGQSDGERSAVANQNQNQNHKIQKPKARRVAAIAPAALPDWLPVNEWKSFLDHRKALRKKMTPHAQELAIKTLEALRTAGQDVAAVLNQSIERGWQGLFEVSNGIAPPKQGSKVAVPKVDNGWMFSEQGTVAKGREFGLEARAGESWNDFRGRIHAKIRETTE